jgi:hypothetical protein
MVAARRRLFISNVYEMAVDAGMRAAERGV